MQIKACLIYCALECSSGVSKKPGEFIGSRYLHSTFSHFSIRMFKRFHFIRKPAINFEKYDIKTLHNLFKIGMWGTIITILLLLFSK